MIGMARPKLCFQGDRRGFPLRNFSLMSTPDTHPDAGHQHGSGCGHTTIKHQGHVDYLVEGRLHHPHGDHCDDHGPVEMSR
jgi:hypothetical protein